MRKYLLLSLFILVSFIVLSCDDDEVIGKKDVQEDQNNCTVLTCSDFTGLECGKVSDNCGGKIDLENDCGASGCTAPEYCGGGGVANMCGEGCVLKTCADFSGLECGEVSDGCGGTIDLELDCGASGCSSSETCGGGGTANMCGSGCVPKTCADFPGLECGEVSDGCGGSLDLVADCGASGCVSPESCSGGGVPNMCGEGCVIKTCADFPNAECGEVSDGCGGTIDLINDCGASGCVSPEICGGSGNPAEAIYCGDPCPERIGCVFLNSDYYECGVISDNCGGIVDLVADCGKPGCSAGETCKANSWGALECVTETCTPKTCADFPGLECGKVNDGCGGVLDLVTDCGNPGCSAPETCGGGGAGPNLCGEPACAFPRKHCDDYEQLINDAIAANEPLCGVIPDGCGGTIDLVNDCGAPGCGSCTPGTPLDLQCVKISRPTDAADAKICVENASGCPGEIVALPVHVIVPQYCTMTDQRSISFDLNGYGVVNERSSVCGTENCIRREQYQDKLTWIQFTSSAIGCTDSQCPPELPVGHVDTLLFRIPVSSASGDFTFQTTHLYLANPCNTCSDYSCDISDLTHGIAPTVRVY